MNSLIRINRIKINNIRSLSILHNYNHSFNKNVLQKEQNHTLIKPSRRNLSLNESIGGIWQSISSSTPVAYFQDGLIQFHDTTGLPWWATIIASTIILRSLITFPLAVYQNKIFARIEKISLEMPDIVKELKVETAFGMKKYNWTEKQARALYNRSLKKQWNMLIVRENCHPAKSLILLWGQIPLWIIQSVSIRNLVAMLPDPSQIQAQIAYTELTLGGFGWIPNLTEVDNSYILPVALGLINLTIIEIQTMTKTKVPNKLQKYATNFFRVLSVGMIPLACYVPSCLCLYWVTSSTYGLAQNLVLLSPKIKRFVGIPITQTELDKPYKHIVDTITQRLRIRST